MYLDLEESLGDVTSARAAYERVLELKVCVWGLEHEGVCGG